MLGSETQRPEGTLSTLNVLRVSYAEPVPVGLTREGETGEYLGRSTQSTRANVMKIDANGMLLCR